MTPGEMSCVSITKTAYRKLFPLSRTFNRFAEYIKNKRHDIGRFNVRWRISDI